MMNRESKHRKRVAVRREKCLALLAAGLLFVAALTACQGLDLKTFKADSIELRAGSGWRQIQHAQLPELYDGWTQADAASVILALAKNNGRDGYLTVQSFPVAKEQSRLDGLLAQIEQRSLSGREDMTKTLNASHFSEREIELLRPIVEHQSISGEERRYLCQEIYLQEYLSSLAADPSLNYRLAGEKDLQLDGRKVQFANYFYNNREKTKLEVLEGNLFTADKAYIVTLWAETGAFQRQRQAFETILSSLNFSGNKQTAGHQSVRLRDTVNL